MLNTVILNVMDFLVGWLLHLPTDAALVVVALGTSAILTFIRPFTTDQDLLRRCRADKKRLGELMRGAKRERDGAALARCRATQGLVAMMQMKAELKPLLVAVLPIAVLAVWCFARLGYLPARPGEPVTVNAYFAASAVGKVVHIVPVEGLSAEGGWVRRVEEKTPGVFMPSFPRGRISGIASWTLRAAGRTEPYVLAIRCDGRTIERPLLVDGRRYIPPVELHEGGDVRAVETVLKSYKPFGFVPGISWLLFDPWLVGYLLLTIPFVFALRKLCRIY